MGAGAIFRPCFRQSVRDRRPGHIGRRRFSVGTAISRTQIEFSDAEIARIADTFNSWCAGKYEDIDGFCKSVTREEIAKNGDSLSPGRYIGTEEVDSENDEDFGTRMQSLTAQLSEQLEESHRLEALISKQLKGLGYDI